MLTKQFVSTIVIVMTTIFLTACGGDNEAEQAKTDAAPATTETTATDMTEKAEEMAVDHEGEETATQLPAEVGEMPAAMAEKVEEAVEETVEQVEEAVTETAAAATAAVSNQTHTVNAQARVFAPEIIYIQPGDTVQWVNMTSHNSVSMEGLIPEGAEGWRSALGENLGVTLTVEGIYAYVCEPHIGFGMVGVIVVGDPGDIDAVNAKAREILQGPYRRLIGKLRKVKPLQ